MDVLVRYQVAMDNPPVVGRHVLTVLHSGERTGPPVLALTLMRWAIAEQQGWRFSAVFLEDGPMVREYARLGIPVAVIEPVDPSGRLPHRLRAWLINRRCRRRVSALGRFDLVHVHCAGSMRALDVIGPIPVLCHLHELDVGLDQHVRPRAAARLCSAERYVAVSRSVRQAFLDRWSVDPDRVQVQWGCVDLAALPEPEQRSELGLDDGADLVVGSGVRHWRKAPDLFVRVAQELVRRHPERKWRFVWVGGHASRDAQDLVRLVHAAGLSGAVTFIEHSEDSIRWAAAADVFLLTSREDAFPLVCIEAAAVGTPIVTFANGGAVELVRSAGCGAVIPFPDVVSAAESVWTLVSDPQRRREAGEAGRRFAAAELTTRVAGPRIVAAMEQAMAVP